MSDGGSALVEFVLLAVLLLVPLCYLLLAVFELQRAAHAATTATREAGRAFVTAPDLERAHARADAAARIAFTDQGLADGDASVRIECAGPEGCLDPGAVVWASVELSVRLPLMPASWLSVQARHAERVDEFRAPRG